MKYWFVFLFILLVSFYSRGQNDSTLYSFFVAGHTYGKPGVNNVGLHPPFLNKFEYIKTRKEIKFGVLLGDIVSAYPTAQDWDEIDTNIDSLGLPIYFAAGNHDVEDRALFESRYGKTYYSFKHQNDLFIVLDPNLDSWNISGNQLAFLKNVVDSNANIADNIYIFFHQVLWVAPNNQFNYITWNSHAGKADTINFWTEVEPIFRHLPNKVIMFAGDLGASWSSDVTFDSYDNITLIATGMGDENGENFVIVNVGYDKSIKYDLICLTDEDALCMNSLESYQVVENILCPKMVVYPNPAVNEIKFCNNVDLVQIYSTQGMLVLETVFLQNKACRNIDISALQSGTYILRTSGSCDSQTLFIKK